MKYVAFVGTGGATPAEAVAEMNRDFPSYLEEMDGRGVRLFGRELDFPDRAVSGDKGVRGRLQPARLRRPGRGGRGDG
jgi:hypothetical protein